MSKARVAVLKVITKQLTVTAAAVEYGYSRRHLTRLLARYREGGLDAVEPRSRAPRSSPQATSETIRDRIVELRLTLTAEGLDAGPVTIAWHLEQEGHPVPSTSTIRRILHQAGLVTPEPRKRPRSSYHRFAAAQPNECWQSDFTHWRLVPDPDSGSSEGHGVEIINWVDDHSRTLLWSSVHDPVTGDVVVDTFLQTAALHGFPASTLTDNGRVYTARSGGGRNAFEYLIAALGITQKNGSPGHPQTQGKVERLQQTQKKWLTRQSPARTLPELQTQLDQFQKIYNTQRPHRSLNRQTPAAVYAALPKAEPTRRGPIGHYRLRYDRVDKGGRVSIRRAGRMHHLGIGRAHLGKPILAITDDTTVTVIELTTSEILSTHHIDPDKNYGLAARLCVR